MGWSHQLVINGTMNDQWSLFCSILAQETSRGSKGSSASFSPGGPRFREPMTAMVAPSSMGIQSYYEPCRDKIVTSATIGIWGTITGSSKCVHFAPFHPTALLNGRHFTDQTSRYTISIGVPIRQRCPNPPLQSIWKIMDSTGYVEQHSSVSSFGVVRTPKFKNLAPSSKNVP